MVIALVAVQHGYTADTLVCPRQARDGDKLLRRVTQPQFGYPHCGPREWIRFADAMARSDNLAAYDVARALPPQALRRGIQAVGMTPDPDPQANLAYALAFGTQAGTPSELLALGQALFGAAYDVPAQGGGPRVLAGKLQPAPAYQQVMALLPQTAQRSELRALLQAPVQHPEGTLHYLKTAMEAGKTGTTSARFGPRPGSRPYVQAKFTLGYVAADQSVALAIINAPAGHALGLHNLAGQTLAPALSVLLK
jgi:membrane peptidoglycan carboxypeptidase